MPRTHVPDVQPPLSVKGPKGRASSQVTNAQTLQTAVARASPQAKAHPSLTAVGSTRARSSHGEDFLTASLLPRAPTGDPFAQIAGRLNGRKRPWHRTERSSWLGAATGLSRKPSLYLATGSSGLGQVSGTRQADDGGRFRRRPLLLGAGLVERLTLCGRALRNPFGGNGGDAFTVLPVQPVVVLKVVVLPALEQQVAERPGEA
jgi:hypothetical protein